MHDHQATRYRVTFLLRSEYIALLSQRGSGLDNFVDTVASQEPPVAGMTFVTVALSRAVKSRDELEEIFIQRLLHALEVTAQSPAANHSVKQLAESVERAIATCPLGYTADSRLSRVLDAAGRETTAGYLVIVLHGLADLPEEPLKNFLLILRDYADQKGRRGQPGDHLRFLVADGMRLWHLCRDKRADSSPFNVAMRLFRGGLTPEEIHEQRSVSMEVAAKVVSLTGGAPTLVDEVLQICTLGMADDTGDDLAARLFRSLQDPWYSLSSNAQDALKHNALSAEGFTQCKVDFACPEIPEVRAPWDEAFWAGFLRVQQQEGRHSLTWRSPIHRAFAVDQVDNPLALEPINRELAVLLASLCMSSAQASPASDSAAPSHRLSSARAQHNTSRGRTSQPEPHALAPLLSAFPRTEYVEVMREYAGGRSGAPVMLVHFKPRRPGGLDGTHVIKVGSQKWAEREMAFHARDLDTLAPFVARSRLSSRQVDGRAAVAYEVAFQRILGTTSLADLVARGGREMEDARSQIQRLARAIVNWNLASAWERRQMGEPYAMLQHYFAEGGVEAEVAQRHSEETLAELARRVAVHLPEWTQEAPRVTIDGAHGSHVLPNPLTYIRAEAWTRNNFSSMRWPFPVGRTHGDLHTGNVICLPGTDEGPSVIDFARARIEGIPFFDLAYLEFDVVSNVLRGATKDAGDQWLALLSSIMLQVYPGARPSGLQADAAWELIIPLRQEVQRLIGVAGADRDGFEVAWWMATVAAGMDFARKERDVPRRWERVTALLYAAFGLRKLDALVDIGTIGGDVSVVQWPRSPSG